MDMVAFRTRHVGQGMLAATEILPLFVPPVTRQTDLRLRARMLFFEGNNLFRLIGILSLFGMGAPGTVAPFTPLLQSPFFEIGLVVQRPGKYLGLLLMTIGALLRTDRSGSSGDGGKGSGLLIGLTGPKGKAQYYDAPKDSHPH